MKYLDALYKNEDIKRTLYGEICSDRLPHAYLIEGAEGSGKKTLAYAVAAELEYRRCADKSADIRESICGKIINGGCTDVILTDKPDDKKSIGIDTIRSFISEANLTPNELDFRFYIINNADVMTVQAQNALAQNHRGTAVGNVYFLTLHRRENDNTDGTLASASSDHAKILGSGNKRVSVLGFKR